MLHFIEDYILAILSMAYLFLLIAIMFSVIPLPFNAVLLPENLFGVGIIRCIKVVCDFFHIF